MISFPQIERIKIQGYGLYPGEDRTGTIDVTLGAGPWLILGANGLGKSTLLHILRFLITGAVNIREAGFAGEREDLQSSPNRSFAFRVNDGAKDATAEIYLKVGRHRLFVMRSLENLRLKKAIFERNDVSEETDNEDEYRSFFCEALGVSQFEDAVRIVDHLVFFLENRKRIIWDGATQFELFRAILTPTISGELRRLEGEIISSDSTARNIQASLSKIVKDRQKEAKKRESADDTLARIASVQGEVDALVRTEQDLLQKLDKEETLRADFNLMQKTAEYETDNAAQAYEKLKFEVLRQAFAGVPPTEQYVFLKLLSDKICLACNQPAHQAAKEFLNRSEEGRCVICGNPRKVEDENIQEFGDVIKAKAEESYNDLEAHRSELEELRKQYITADEDVSNTYSKLKEVKATLEKLHSTLRSLRKKLPTDQAASLSREEEKVSILRSEVQVYRAKREVAEREFEELLIQFSSAVESIRSRIEDAFNRKAEPFFAEKVRLVYAPRTTRMGQGAGGRQFEFPAFEVEMTSGATFNKFVRRSLDQVSLSQAEYLDLIFRMIVLKEVGDGSSSLIVDGPEGSLDAVFADRAGDLFSSFTKEANANVILACNVVEGGFIPHTLSAFSTVKQRKARVVNLLDLGMPTRALAELRPEYQQKVDAILEQGIGNDASRS